MGSISSSRVSPGAHTTPSARVSCLRQCIDGLLTQHVYQLRRRLLWCKILDTLRRSIYPEGLLKREWLIEAKQLVDFDTHALVASFVVSKKPCS